MGSKKWHGVCVLDKQDNRTTTEDTKTPVIIGLDISTTCTAVCVLDAKTGAHIKTYHALMNNATKFPSFWSKVKNMKDVFDAENDPQWDVKAVAVEESAKRFTPGFSSADTIITLAKFNGILCYILLDKYGLEPTYINVRSARKKLGITIDKTSKTPNKKQVMEQVIKNNSTLPWVYKTSKDGVKSLVKINEDRADSFVIAKCAFLTKK